MLRTPATEFDVEIVNINVAEMYVAAKPTKIITLLGSCVAICIWESLLRIGGMNHYLLPHTAGKKYADFSSCDCTKDYRYGCVSTEALIQRINSAGAKKGNLVAKVFGGGEVMYNDGLKKPKGKNIGLNNVRFAENFLRGVGITIVAKDTGGKDARKIIFNTETGQVLVKRLSVSTIEENLL